MSYLRREVVTMGKERCFPHHAGQGSLFWIQAVHPVMLQTVKR